MVSGVANRTVVARSSEGLSPHHSRPTPLSSNAAQFHHRIRRISVFKSHVYVIIRQSLTGGARRHGGDAADLAHPAPGRTSVLALGRHDESKNRRFYIFANTHVQRRVGRGSSRIRPRALRVGSSCGPLPGCPVPAGSISGPDPVARGGTTDRWTAGRTGSDPLGSRWNRPGIGSAGG
jgi:hypothetical protein